uniref:Ras-associating domain-containing protein n=1 Tax=Plectus sambesii TaxID=2011161 RepID=A0A914W3J7_9BILA
MLKYQVRNSGTLTRPPKNRRPSIDDDGHSGSSNASASSASYLSWNQSLSPSTSSTGSLQLRGRSSSVSSLSSAGSSNESSVEWGQLKVHTGNVRTETDYKTLLVNTHATAEEVVNTLLSKFRLTTRDPKLFRLTMEIKTKREGVDVTNVLMLERDAKPLELQRCHPKGMSRFVLQMGAGTLVRIFDFSISPESNYKSVLVSTHTTCHETIRLLLQMSRLPMAPEQFILVVVEKRDGMIKEYPLPRESFLVSVTDVESDTQQVHLRRFAQERLSLLTPAQSLAASDSAVPMHRFVRRNSTRRPGGLSDRPILEMDLCAIQFEERCVV